MKAAEDELTSLCEMGVYKLVPCSSVPASRRILNSWFVCHRKRDMLSVVVRHKVRWVTKGYEQIFGLDYNATMSPTAHLESFRILLHIAAMKGWDITVRLPW
jgi:hypothetical protein